MLQYDPNGCHGSSSYHSILAAAFVRHKEAYLRDHGPNYDRFGPADEAKIVLCLLTAALIEGLANAYLASLLSSEEFEKIEWTKTPAKWGAAIQGIVNGYSLPSFLADTLKNLFDQRNRIMHLKADIVRGGETVIEGKHPALSHTQVMKWIALPHQLLRNLISHDRRADVLEASIVCHVQLLGLRWGQESPEAEPVEEVRDKP